ncbi:MAG: hypothetical protein Q8Q00_04475 [Dehalococcoidia bacterium]|nr:hypothetical protein [Dehalococcoidia bacterium]
MKRTSEVQRLSKADGGSHCGNPLKALMWGVVVVGVVGAVFGALALNGNDASAAKENSPFVGHWETIDVFDGSYMQMSISPGLSVKLVDDWGCAGQSGGGQLVTAKGKGVLLSPIDLEVDLSVWCTVAHVRFPGAPTIFTSIGPDILLDPQGNIWTRQ